MGLRLGLLILLLPYKNIEVPLSKEFEERIEYLIPQNCNHTYMGEFMLILEDYDRNKDDLIYRCRICGKTASGKELKKIAKELNLKG